MFKEHFSYWQWRLIFFYGVSQLISDSLKAKQLQTSLHAEKQELNVRIQHANISADKYKQRIARLEEQVSS
jgi:E3 ubiquitin-protein ligase BRE1